MTNNPKIKICGVKDIKISKLLLDLNIDFLGLNFIEKSSRFISLKEGKRIINEINIYNGKALKKLNQLIEFTNRI